MQLHRAACYWFPWWVSKINIKVCDRRVAYWFSRSRGCSRNVSTFDLWLVFMFSDNTADCGGERGFNWGDCGSTRHPSTPSVHKSPTSLRPHRHETVPVCIGGDDIWIFSAHEVEIWADAWISSAQIERFIDTCSQRSSNFIRLIQYCIKKNVQARLRRMVCAIAVRN